MSKFQSVALERETLAQRVAMARAFMKGVKAFKGNREAPYKRKPLSTRPIGINRENIRNLTKSNKNNVGPDILHLGRSSRVQNTPTGCGNMFHYRGNILKNHIVGLILPANIVDLHKITSIYVNSDTFACPKFRGRVFSRTKKRLRHA